MIPPDNRIWFNILKNELPSHEKIEEAWIHVTKWKKSIWKCYMIYGSTMTFWERQKYLEERERWIDREWWR